MSTTGNTEILSGTDLPPKAEDGTQTTESAQHQAHRSGSKTQESLEQLEKDFQETTNEAVAEGQADITAATATYLEQALKIADTGLTTAQTYVGAGKERLQHHPNESAPTGFAASLAASAASALDVASGYIGLAHQQLHEKGHFPHDHTAGAVHPHPHPVTSHTKPLGEALGDTYAAAHATVQPHVDVAKATVEPHVEAAKATVQPHIDATSAAVQEAAQPYVESAKAALQEQTSSSTGESAPVAEEKLVEVDSTPAPVADESV